MEHMDSPELTERALPEHQPSCFVCGTQNEHGLGATRALRGDRVVVRFTPQQEHEGAPGLIHGGVLAAAFDESLGTAPYFLAQKICVTGTLNVVYRKPVPIGVELSVEGWVEQVDGRKVHVAGKAYSGGTFVAEATAIFIEVPLEHFKGRKTEPIGP